jgi:hypothetical protein
MKKNLGKNSGKVLNSYQKVGTKFIPPILQKLQFEYTSWSSQTMPELIWWDVLIDRASHRFAARVAEELAEHFKAKNNQERWWAFISDYSDLSDERAHELREHLAKANLLSQLTESLGDFLYLYPSCPLSKLLEREPHCLTDVDYLSHFEDRLGRLDNKRSRNGVIIQAQAIYMAFMSGRFHVKEGLALADFPEVERYPDTDRSLEVGASICATVNMLAGNSFQKYTEDTWVQYFWRRSCELKPLSFLHLGKK